MASKISPGHKNRSLVLVVWIPHCFKVTIFSLLRKSAQTFCSSILEVYFSLGILSARASHRAEGSTCVVRRPSLTQTEHLSCPTSWSPGRKGLLGPAPCWPRDVSYRSGHLDLTSRVVLSKNSNSILPIFVDQDLHHCAGGNKFKDPRSQKGHANA